MAWLWFSEAFCICHTFSTEVKIAGSANIPFHLWGVSKLLWVRCMKMLEMGEVDTRSVTSWRHLLQWKDERYREIEILSLPCTSCTIIKHQLMASVLLYSCNLLYTLLWYFFAGMINGLCKTFWMPLVRTSSQPLLWQTIVQYVIGEWEQANLVVTTADFSVY